MVNMSVTSYAWGDATVVHLDGQLDIDTGGVFEASLRDLMDRSPQRIVIDLSALTFCDSTGLSSLVLAHGRCMAAGGFLRLAAPTPFLLRVITAVGLRDRFPMYTSIAAAIDDDLSGLVL